MITPEARVAPNTDDPLLSSLRSILIPNMTAGFCDFDFSSLARAAWQGDTGKPRRKERGDYVVQDNVIRPVFVSGV
jgi:hypothetical protein